MGRDLLLMFFIIMFFSIFVYNDLVLNNKYLETELFDEYSVFRKTLIDDICPLLLLIYWNISSFVFHKKPRE